MGAPLYGPIGIVVAESLYAFPHAVLILVTALALSDGRLREAAEALGTTRRRMFWTITLPGARYGLISAGFVVFTLVVTDFGIPKVIGGQFSVLATDAYRQVVGQQNFPMGAVVGIILLVPAVVAYFVDRAVQRRQSALLSARAVPYVPQPERKRDLALLALAILIGGTIVAIYGTAVWGSFVRYWPYNLSLTLKNYDFATVEPSGWAPYWTSLQLASLTAAIGTTLIFTGAYLIEKLTFFPILRSFAQFLAMLPMAVPGLVLGLGYVFFFNATWNPLGVFYGTLTILVVNTIAHFYTVGHITALTSLKQIDSASSKPSPPRSRCRSGRPSARDRPDLHAGDPRHRGLYLRQRAHHGFGRDLPLWRRHEAGLDRDRPYGRGRRGRPRPPAWRAVIMLTAIAREAPAPLALDRTVLRPPAALAATAEPSLGGQIMPMQTPTQTLLALAGEVALLLWSVQLVTAGVSTALGSRLRTLAASGLSSRWRSFLAGLGVTAVLQSSTATALMISSFAGAGLVALPAALAMMLGANVGTTLLVQVVSFDISPAIPILLLAGYVGMAPPCQRVAAHEGREGSVRPRPDAARAQADAGDHAAGGAFRRTAYAAVRPVGRPRCRASARRPAELRRPFLAGGHSRRDEPRNGRRHRPGGDGRDGPRLQSRDRDQSAGPGAQRRECGDARAARQSRQPARRLRARSPRAASDRQPAGRAAIGPGARRRGLPSRLAISSWRLCSCRLCSPSRGC
jgi:ABC-type spermidine/putrescine transport system permease subunit II